MDVEKLILLVKDHEAIYDASRCELHLTLMMTIFITTKTTVIMFLLLLGLLFQVFICYFWHSKE